MPAASKNLTRSKWDPAPRTPEQKAFVARFDFERHDAPALVELRERYRLDEIVAPATSELEHLQRISDWTYERFKIFGRPTAKTENALEILSCAEAGHTFYCAHYAIVMSAAATALGWHARPVSLRRADYPDGVSNHNVVELWLPSREKWILWDPTLNYYMEQNGIPVNCYEAGRALIRDNGVGVEIVVSLEPKRITIKDLPLNYREYPGFGWQRLDVRGLSAFACVAHLPTNRLMGAYKDRTIEHWSDWPGIQPILTAESTWTDDASTLAPYYPVKRMD